MHAATASTALVLTALPVETTAVLAHLSADRSVQMCGPILCETGYFMASGGRLWQVAVAEVGAGTVDTAGAVVAVTAWLRPDVVMFAGIAGALKDDLHIGDVVAGTAVAWTERGKWSQVDFLPRIQTVSLSAPLVQLARKIARDGNWRRRLEVSRPDGRAVVGQIASGEKVVADDEYRAWLRTAFSDALAIENEGFALARTAEVYADGQRYVVRGISDRADGSKNDDGHASAAAAAAAFAFELLDACSATQVTHPDGEAFGLSSVGSGLAAASPVVTRSLPADVGSFTGREAELDRLVEGLPSPADPAGVIRIGAIDGMAGIGKTAFAVHAAHRLSGHFPDGQLFVRLHAHTPSQRPADPGDVLAALLQAHGIPPNNIPPALDERAALWRGRMAGRRTLMVLDDAADSEQVRPLLPASAGSAVLVTSRHRLTALADAWPVTLDTLPADQAARLFIRLAGRPGLIPGDTTVAAICDICGYLPLALSLVAAQLRHHPAWTVTDLAADLTAAEDRLAPMAAESISVATSFDLSYRNLPENRKRLFRRLGLHPGTDIDRYAAAALDDADPAVSRRGLDDLFSCHLLDEPVHGRYRFHDLIQAHARALAGRDAPAERDAAISRLLDYYLHAARSARYCLTPSASGESAATAARRPHSPDLRTTEDATRWLESERFNLQAAAKLAAAHDHADHAIGIAAAIRSFLRTRGHWDQAITLHHTALTAALRTGDRHAEADAMTGIGETQRLAGHWAVAEASLARALDLYRDLGSEEGEADALSNLGVLQRVTGNYHAAASSQERAISLFRKLGYRIGEADALSELGAAQYSTRNYEESAVSLNQALVLFQNLGDKLGQADALIYIALLKQLTGDNQAAATSAEHALALHREIGNHNGEANALTRLGALRTQLGDQRAAANLNRALELHRDLGGKLGQANALYYLGILQRLTAHHQAAADTLAQASDLYRDLGNHNGYANALGELSVVNETAGDYPAAIAYLSEALELHTNLGNRLGQANVLSKLGAVQRASGYHAKAMGNLNEALALYRDDGDRSERANAFSQIGLCWLATGHYEEADESFARALNLCRLAGNPNGEAEVLNNVGQLRLASDQTGQARSSHESALVIAASAGLSLEQARAMEGIGISHMQEGHAARAALMLRQALAKYQQAGSPRAALVESTLAQIKAD